jgi:hypothetical protein
MAYIGNSNGTEKNLFELAEIKIFGGDPRQLSPLANSGIRQINGGTAYPMKDLHLAPVAPTSGYLYSAETVMTGFHVGGTQIKLCKPGCRPGARQMLYRFTNNSYSDVVKYINSFANGEIWVSNLSGARSGTKISKKLADWATDEALPRGMLYSVCCLVGAGGGGGAAGLLLAYDNNGGSGGVGFCLSRWLRPSSGCDIVTVLLGGVGKGAAKGILNAGSAGGTSYIAGRMQVTGGGGANGGANNAPAQISTMSYPWSSTYQTPIASSNGSVILSTPVDTFSSNQMRC